MSHIVIYIYCHFHIIVVYHNGNYIDKSVIFIHYHVTFHTVYIHYIILYSIILSLINPLYFPFNQLSLHINLTQSVMDQMNRRKLLGGAVSESVPANSAPGMAEVEQNIVIGEHPDGTAFNNAGLVVSQQCSNSDFTYVLGGPRGERGIGWKVGIVCVCVCV